MFVSVTSTGVAVAGFAVAVLGLMVIGVTSALLHHYLAPREQVFEAGRVQGRREMLKEMNGARRVLIH
jgi:hypothetical protein